MGCAMGTVRYILFFFNFLLALAGLGILILGVMTVNSKEASLDDVVNGQLSTPAVVTAIVGACVFIFAFFGCCGALRESHCMVVTYAVLLLTLFLLQVAVAVLAYTFRGQAKDGLTQGLEKVFNDYNTKEEDKKIIDNMQESLQCCGSTDVQSPWSTLGMTAPPSCYPKNSTTMYNEGCIPKLVNIVQNALTLIGEVAIGVGVVEVVGIIFSLCLANSIRRSELRGYA